jgi:transketolase
MKISNNLPELCKNYRKILFEKFLEVGQGHPGSVFSMTDIVVTLFHNSHIRFNEKTKKFNDKIIISKGHATVALYPILKEFGVIEEKEWENWGKKDKESILRVFGNTSIPGIDATSGSLGHGLGIGCGLAYLYEKKKIDKKVYVVISEGELYEGSTWEALLFAAHHNLKNLNIIIDENSLIILGKTEDCLKLDPIKKKIEGFGFNVHQVDGHNTDELEEAFSEESNNTKIILAKTVKGKGFSIMENKANWHYWNTISEKEIEICRKDIA